MKQPSKKLALRHQTIRHLSTLSLARAIGGAPESEATCQPTTVVALDSEATCRPTTLR